MTGFHFVVWSVDLQSLKQEELSRRPIDVHGFAPNFGDPSLLEEATMPVRSCSIRREPWGTSFLFTAPWTQVVPGCLVDVRQRQKRSRESGTRNPFCNSHH